MYTLPTLATLGWFILLFFVLWIIISIPIYVASRIMVSRRKASLGRAIVTTFLAIVAFLVLSGLFGLILGILGLIIGFIGILAVLRVMYDIDWINAFVMAIIAIIFIIVISVVFALVGLAIGLSSLTSFGGIPR